MEKKTIGSFIAALRKEAGLTQRELAEQLGVSDKSVSRWERDECAPDLSLIPIIADFFDITADELLRGERKMHMQERPLSEEETETRKQKEEKRFGTRLRKKTQHFKEHSGILLGISLTFYFASMVFYFACQIDHPVMELFAILHTITLILSPFLYIPSLFLEVNFMRHTEIPEEEIMDKERHRIYQNDIIKRAGRYFAILWLPIGGTLAIFAPGTIRHATISLLDVLLFTLLFLVFFYFIGYLVFALIVKPLLYKRGTWRLTETEIRLEKKKTKTLALVSVISAVLAIALFCTMVYVWRGPDEYGIFVKKLHFDDPEAFVEFMETPVDFDENAPLYSRNIENENQEILCTYLQKNNDVIGVYVRWYTDEFYVDVTTKSAVQKAETIRITLTCVLAVLTVSELLIASWIYTKRERKIALP